MVNLLRNPLTCQSMNTNVVHVTTEWKKFENFRMNLSLNAQAVTSLS
jgi:hypothetical protein